MSLVELLVAMVIGLVLLGGVYQVFTGSTASSRENQQFSRLQENTRFAMQMIGRDIRDAGYAGCAGKSEPPISMVVPVFGAETAGNSVLTLRGIPERNFFNVTVGTNTSVTLGATTGLLVGDTVLVSDCSGGDVVQISGISTNTLTFSSLLSKTYAPPAEVSKYQTITYSLQGNPLGLFRQVGTSSAKEVIANVERMQIRYGIDPDGDRQVDSYVTAAVASADWSEVAAVRVALLLQTEISGKTPDDTATYDLDGADGLHGQGTSEYGPINDRRMRRVFKATFTLRNKVP